MERRREGGNKRREQGKREKNIVLWGERERERERGREGGS